MLGTGRRRSAATGALVVALAFGLGGCGDGETTITTEDGSVTIDSDGDGGSVTIDSSEGSVTVTTETGGELPDGWPSEVAIPDGGSVEVSGSYTGEEGTSWNVGVKYAGADPADIADQMKSNLEGAGFVMEAEYTAGDQSVASYTGKGFNVVATTTEQDGDALLNVAIAPET